MLCYLFIMGKFILVLYKEIKEYGIFGMQLFSHNAVSNDYNGLSDQPRCYDGNTGSPQCSTHWNFFPQILTMEIAWIIVGKLWKPNFHTNCNFPPAPTLIGPQRESESLKLSRFFKWVRAFLKLRAAYSSSTCSLAKVYLGD
jgi:hypothetical protein